MSQINVLEASAATQTVLNGDRAWQIYTRFGTDDRPEPKLPDAFAAYCKRFKIAAAVSATLKGTATPWKNGAPSGPPVSLQVALATAAELNARKAPEAPKSEA